MHTLEKTVSTLTVRLLVQTHLSNTSIASSSSVPHSRISPCCNSLRYKHSEESGYFPSPSVRTKLAIYFKGCKKTKFRPWRVHMPCTLNTLLKDFFLSTLIQKNLLTGCLYFCTTSCISLAASNKAWLQEFKTKTQYQKTSLTREATSFLYP